MTCEEACSRRSVSSTKGDETRRGGGGEVTKHGMFGSVGRSLLSRLEQATHDNETVKPILPR